PVFRKNVSTAKKTVIPSYLSMLDKMNFVEGEDYKYNKNDYEITILKNGSKIVFTEADRSKDRQGQKIKGINATANHVDEGDELDEIMFNHAVSRKGRKNERGQPSIAIITMNTSRSFLKEKYYVPWKNGNLPKDVRVIEYTIDDSWQDKKDIEAMLRNPKPWVERYVNNNWNYEVDQDSLFKY